jgi:hypothetical protein
VIARLIVLSGMYWTVALLLAYIAVFAPCGLVPGAWCETEGPNWFGAVLGFLGPIGVLIVAAMIYGLALWRLVLRQRKQQH